MDWVAALNPIKAMKNIEKRYPEAFASQTISREWIKYVPADDPDVMTIIRFREMTCDSVINKHLVVHAPDGQLYIRSIREMGALLHVAPETIARHTRRNGVYARHGYTMMRVQF